MIHRCTMDAVLDLEQSGQLVRIRQPVDPHLEMAEIHRRVFAANGPAIFYEVVKGSPFPAVSNLFGTLDRARFLFRHTLHEIHLLMEIGADPFLVFRHPGRYRFLPLTLWRLLPKQVAEGPVCRHTTTISRLPLIHCWPKDGGPFILLPQVYTENPVRPGIFSSNIGMYRIQMAGNDYTADRELGLHYQIRRDIAAHHGNALSLGEPLKLSVFVGGPPAHGFAAVMPLPEGMPEAAFAGALAGRRFHYARQNGFVLSTDADFCIIGMVRPGETKPEGPFGDHLGYYSLAHPFPVIRVMGVYHRPNAVWPFTVVGRPPQEDSIFGNLIHEITGPMVPKSIPGLDAIHAVDAAGVHPLLLAIGRERYVPGDSGKPRELLKIANALLGFGACALAKYLFITAREGAEALDIHDIPAYFRHVLERVDWRADLHFHTHTTMDTLDYSGTGFNEGSKVVIAAAGGKQRELATDTPGNLKMPAGFGRPVMVLPGVMVMDAPPFGGLEDADKEMGEIAACLSAMKNKSALPLVVLADDSEFAGRTLNNFLWVTFTRSNPSHDIHGAGSFTHFKHWGCEGPLIIDARIKPHHAPVLTEDPKITARVEAMGKKGGPLHGII